MIFLLLLPLVFADVYMHSPRGSNDRNCERNVNRNNGNRLFDSQNNAKGGYACPRAVSGSNANYPPKGLSPSMRFEVGSKVEVEWTAQHGCGAKRGGTTEMADPSVHCEMVVQMICAQTTDPNTEYGKMYAGQANLEYLAAPRQGIPNNDNDAATNRIGTNDPGQAQGTNGNDGNAGNLRFAVHETPQYYNECNRVSRNRGLFTADQNVNRRSAIGTRQNPNGGRRGLECPEERDYYPYWRPAPFVDVAYLVDDPARCGAGTGSTLSAANMISTGEMCGGTSGNICGAGNAEATSGSGDWVGNCQGCQLDPAKPAMWNWLCAEKATGKTPKQAPATPQAARNDYNQRRWANNAAKCATYGDAFEWKQNAFTAGAKEATTAQKVIALQQKGPECGVMDWSRANHLGNNGANGDDTASRYTMTIPAIDTAAQNNALVTGEPCALRLRYNMSSSDYIRATNASSNQGNGVQSPIRQDPLVKVGPNDVDYVELALNTNQVARTFQDRSYIFYVQPKVAGEGITVLNINVRGKRGNIVQTYPAVEYDLIPNAVQLAQGTQGNTIMRFQWTGSDYNPRRGCNDGEGGPYVGDNNVGQALANNANTQGSNQNSRMDRMTLLPVIDNKKLYPVAMQQGATQRIGAAWFKDAAQAAEFGTGGCVSQLKANGNVNMGVYPKLVAQQYTPLTGDQVDNINNENRRENHPRNCAEGNAISPYFAPQDVAIKTATGKTDCLFSPRNNNFSNRETRVCVSVMEANAIGGAPVPAQYVTVDPTSLITSSVEFADENSLNYTNSLESDAPPFEPVENDDYGDGQKEGCTQTMLLFTGSAATYTPFYFLFLALIQLF